jgi:hypothetical protein
VLHATASAPQGPYTLKDVALGARDGTWDGETQHNPAAVRAADGTYLLFHMGAQAQDIVASRGLLPGVNGSYTCPMGSSTGPHETVCMQRVGLATAASPDGPWGRRWLPVLPAGPAGAWDDLFTTNPTPHAFANGSVLLIYKARSRANPGVMNTGVAVADSWGGPYRRVGGGPIALPGNCEDAGIYFSPAMKVFRMLLHCGCDYQSVWSRDGLRWTRSAPPAPWCNVSYAGGGSEMLKRRERPKWVMGADGQPTHLLTGVGPSTSHAPSRASWTMATVVRR